MFIYEIQEKYNNIDHWKNIKNHFPKLASVCLINCFYRNKENIDTFF